MQSLWNADSAKPFLDDPLALRVYTSRLLGQNPALVLHGGGNTSVKTTIQSLFGEPIEVLYVKGSGWDLATIEPAGFAPVRLDVLLKMATLPTLSDNDMVLHQRAAMTNPNAPTPSVEAILHALIPFQYVDHTHADAVVTLSNNPDGEARIRALYGDDLLIIPYVMPGFILARTIYEMTRDIDWSRLRGMILLNHGVFTFADDARTSYERMIDIVTMAENELATRITESFPRIEQSLTDEDLRTLAQLRKRVSHSHGRAVLASIDMRPEIVGFASLPDVADLINRGTLTPDHVIRTKRTGLYFDGNLDAVDEYATAYRAYFDRQAPRYSHPLTMLDPAPRYAIWQNRGMIAFGKTPSESAIITDILEHTQMAIQQAERLGGWVALPEADIFDVEYWDLEQAKLKKSGSDPSLRGKIALVTGAASGIGKACVEALLKQGTVVAALDLNPAISDTFKRMDVLPIVCDVTDEGAIQRALRRIIETFGGLDIVISNAGIFPPSMTVKQMDMTLWSQSIDINLTSHLRLLHLCLPYLEHGIDPAVVLIASKNVPAPGVGAGAYSVAKAGLTQLGRVAALELGKVGIRVNMLHPDAVFDTGIWTPEILEARAKNYGLTVDQYKRRNVLGVEVTSQQVAELATAMVGSLFARTTGAQIPIDGGNDRVI